MTDTEPTSSLLHRLARIDASSLSDADKSLRVVSPAIRPVRPGVRLLGRAVTAQANADLMSVIAALQQAGEGDVLVVEAGSPDWAVAGELFATEAVRRGLAGIVIDGLCRDTPTLRTLDLPVFSRGATPRACPARKLPIVQVAVSVGGVVINPGDLLLGDDDGIVVGTDTELAAALDRAEAIQAGEEALRASIVGGTSIFAALNYQDHLARLEAGRDTALSLGF